MEATLRKLGFEVRAFRDLDLQHMEAAIDEFAAGLASGSLAFFYFSGHGVQVNFANYLLPIDFAAASETDVKYKAYPATRIQEKLEASGARLRILVLDACRNNPFRYKRDALGGLAAMPVNAEGTLIAFATGDNNTADDNAPQANGLYTKHLMPALLAPGLQLREAFQKAKEEVFTASNRSQNPSIYENIVGTYYLVSPPPRINAADEAWNLIRNSPRAEDFERFAAAFPDSELAAAARLRASQLRNAPAPSTGAVSPSLSAGNTAPGRTMINPNDGLTYVWIPPGTFMMGCSPGDKECEANEMPAHQVTLTKGFWIGQTEVTQQAYQRAKGSNPSRYKGARLPVETVPWEEAQAYCKAVGMRLPTEAEWEYAARGGDTSARYGDVDSIAWKTAKTHEVGRKRANGFRLYDMLGNVWEWVSDTYPDFPHGYGSSLAPLTDPQATGNSEARVARGGLRVSSRDVAWRIWRSSAIGFRCAGD
jgi:formylglycine-generating enzyme required for sulfatase activity